MRFALKAQHYDKPISADEGTTMLINRKGRLIVVCAAAVAIAAILLMHRQMWTAWVWIWS
jgi:hypothetical protein